MARHLKTGPVSRSKYASKTFWIDAGDRAIASFAQAGLSAGLLETSGILGVDWTGMLSLATGTALASVLSSIAFRGKPSEEYPGDREDDPTGALTDPGD